MFVCVCGFLLGRVGPCVTSPHNQIICNLICNRLEERRRITSHSLLLTFTEFTVLMCLQRHADETLGFYQICSSCLAEKAPFSCGDTVEEREEGKEGRGIRRQHLCACILTFGEWRLIVLLVSVRF